MAPTPSDQPLRVVYEARLIDQEGVVHHRLTVQGDRWRSGKPPKVLVTAHLRPDTRSAALSEETHYADVEMAPYDTVRWRLEQEADDGTLIYRRETPLWA